MSETRTGQPETDSPDKGVEVNNLAEVRHVFGTFLVQGRVIVGADRRFRGEQMDRICLCTTSMGDRGPKGKDKSEVFQPGAGFIDFAVTSEQAVDLYRALQDRLKTMGLIK